VKKLKKFAPRTKGDKKIIINAFVLPLETKKKKIYLTQNNITMGYKIKISVYKSNIILSYNYIIYS